MLGEAGPCLHGVVDFFVVGVPAFADVVVRDFGAFAELGLEGDVERREQPRVDLFVEPVAFALHVRFVEVHENGTFIHLDDAVLQPCGDAEFFVLHAEDDARLEVLRDVLVRHAVELHQRAKCGGDDGARPGHADAGGDGAVVFQPEAAVVQRDAALGAFAVKALHRRLEQPHPAVVAVKRDVGDELVDAVEPRMVALVRDDLDFLRLDEFHPRGVVADDKGDGLAEVTIRRIADEPSAGECFSANGEWSVCHEKCAFL